MYDSKCFLFHSPDQRRPFQRQAYFLFLFYWLVWLDVNKIKPQAKWCVCSAGNSQGLTAPTPTSTGKIRVPFVFFFSFFFVEGYHLPWIQAGIGLRKEEWRLHFYHWRELKSYFIHLCGQCTNIKQDEIYIYIIYLFIYCRFDGIAIVFRLATIPFSLQVLFLLFWNWRSLKSIFHVRSELKPRGIHI